MEELFDAAVVEGVDEAAVGFGRDLDFAGASDAVGVERRIGIAGVGVEAGEHDSAGAHDVHEAEHDGVEQGFRQVLEVVPDECGIEVALRKREDLFKKLVLAGGGDVGDGRVAFAEDGVDSAEKILGVEAVTERGEESDVVLVHFTEVEDLEVLVIAQDVEHLLEGVGVAGDFARYGLGHELGRPGCRRGKGRDRAGLGGWGIRK